MNLPRAHDHAHAGHWPSPEATGSVTLSFDDRHRRRLRLDLNEGGSILLDLPRAVAMADGDGLKLDSGGWVAVKAASEPVVEITADDRDQFIRIAWHLGNRHLPTQVSGEWLRIRPDHVIEEMVVGLGGTIRHIDAPFQPEGGAYEGHKHSHGDHRHD
ncbi:MAG: urease accessory protein UreE [Pseudomonadota bacterium]